MLKNIFKAAIALMALVVLSSCTSEVPPGTVGRVSTRNGWTEDILKPGRHTAYGYDKMYLLDTTNKSFKEMLNILVGGKINLKVDLAVRVRVNTDDEALIRKSFERVTATDYHISLDQIYITFLQMKTQAIPRGIFEIQPDIQTAVANSPALAMEVRKQITEMAASTPLIVEDVQITNYDWPDSITKAQEELVKIQLKEAAAAAQVRADLQQAKGQLAVEEAKKLIEMKRAEAVAESMKIIKGTLGGAAEYLLWHQIRVMGEAAMGPNNAFILYPFGTDASQIRAMMGNANLTQMLEGEGVKLDLKKSQTLDKK